MGIFKFLDDLKKACFYGEVLIKFEYGKIVLVTEVVKHKDITNQ